MSKVIDVRKNGGDLVILGKALVLPNSSSDGTDLPLDGSTRYNPDTDTVELYSNETWNPITGTGTEDDAPPAHTHTVGQVTGLQAALDGKSPTVHSHPISEVTGLQAALDDKAALTHDEAIANIINLQETLDGLTTGASGKAPTDHSHAIVSITGLQTALNNKAPLNHTHQTSAITGFNEAAAFYKNMQLDVTFNGANGLGPAAGDVYFLPICINTRILNGFSNCKVSTAAWPSSETLIHVSKVGETGTVVLGDIVLTSSGYEFDVAPSAVGYFLMPGDYLKFDSTDWGNLSAPVSVAFFLERI